MNYVVFRNGFLSEVLPDHLSLDFLRPGLRRVVGDLLLLAIPVLIKPGVQRRWVAAENNFPGEGVENPGQFDMIVDGHLVGVNILAVPGVM